MEWGSGDLFIYLFYYLFWIAIYHEGDILGPQPVLLVLYDHISQPPSEKYVAESFENVILEMIDLLSTKPVRI